MSESETAESVAICWGTIEQKPSGKMEEKHPFQACRGLTRKVTGGGKPGSDWPASLCVLPSGTDTHSCMSTLGVVDTAGIQHLPSELESE